MFLLKQLKLVKILPLLLIIISCSNDLEVLSVARDKMLSINTDLSEDRFITSDCQLIQGQWELRLVPHTTEYALYKRITLVAQGPAGNPYNEFRLAVTFNVSDVNNMVHLYEYLSAEPAQGNTVNEVTLLLRQGSNWTSYNLCGLPNDFFNIAVERQSVSERILKGFLIGRLCLNDEVINVAGQFRDIPY